MIKTLLVDNSSLAVTLFYAMGGQQFLDAEEVDVDEVNAFLHNVSNETIVAIQRRVSMDGYDQVRIALESPPWAPVWRYEVYDDYKDSHSNPNKPKVASKLQPIINQAAIEAGLKTLYAPHMEADDVIGTMVYLLQDRWDTMLIDIWSQDKDLHQLIVHPNIRMVGKAGAVTTKADVLTEWGHSAEAIPLIKALAGDKSDNIKGVNGIGPKKAAQMIRYAPHRRGSKYLIAVDKLPEKKRLSILNEWGRIERDTNLCTVVKNANLQSGIDYGKDDEEGRRDTTRVSEEVQPVLSGHV